MNVILIGFMGSGKTTVAKKLSYFLRLPLLEMDELVFQKTETKNMHEVFALGGEFLLRETELAIAQEYACKTNMIVSTGGGVILNKIVLDHLKGQEGKVFFLDASFELVVNRLEKDKQRPLLENLQKAKSMYHFRYPLYLKYADHVIDVGEKSVEKLAQEIAGMTCYGK